MEENDMTTFPEEKALVTALYEKAAASMALPVVELWTSRRLEVAQARQVVSYTLRSLGWPLVRIGDAMGLDHATVHHSVQKVERRARVDADCRDLVVALARVAREYMTGGTTKDRALAAVRAMDRELAVASEVREELASRIRLLLAARNQLGDLLEQLHVAIYDQDIPTRVRKAAG